MWDYLTRISLIHTNCCKKLLLRLPKRDLNSRQKRAESFLILLLLAFACCHSTPAQDFEFFEKKIRPVLVEHCYRCHSHEAEKIKGELFLDSKEGMLKGGSSGKPAIVPDEPEASKLIEAIRYSNSELQMPPPKFGKLTEQQIADFIAWVKTGAPDPRTKEAKEISISDKHKIAKEHWAFQPLKTPAVPKITAATRSRSANEPKTPIDNFIIEKLSSNGLQLSPPADKRTLIRRATFDLTGLPPTPEQVEAFLSDKSPDAFAKVVDRLLTSPHYGERWGRYWLDVARFADTKGYVYGDREETKFIQSAAYRDWVIKAFNEDMPYDRFVKLQIAADQLEETDINSLAAMGFLTLGRRFLGVVHDIIDDRIDVVMRGTQALTVGCARCHDHKFDPIPTRDYYSLYGVFAGCNEREVPLKPDHLSVSGYLAFEKELKTREDKFQSLFNAKRDALSKRLRSKVTDYLVAVLNVEKFPSEEFYSFVQADDLNAVIVRAWHSYLLSTAKSFHPIWAPWHVYAALPKNEFAAKAGPVLASCTNASQKLNPLVEKAFSEKTPSSMVEVAETYGKLLSTIDKKWNDAADKAKALSKEEEELRQLLYAEDSPATVPAGAIVDLEWYFDEGTRVELGKLCSQIDKWILQSTGAPPYAVILEDRPVQKNPRVFKRGNPVNKGEEVPKQFLEILAGETRQPFSKGSGRLGLAEAIAAKENPLTARVFVNRIWLHHFGAGLVRTPSDFGVRAEPPTHPQLLDWLAAYFMDNGWSVKKMHRLMMLSAVYQQTSVDTSPDSQRSKQLKSSSRTDFMPVKLEASSPGKLASQIDPENKLLWRMNRQRLDFEALRDSLLAVSGQLDTKVGGKAEDMFKAPYCKRRSVYGFIDRQFLPGALRIFDFANPDMHNPQRSETTVPQQALFFMNSPFVAEQARALAARIGEKGEEKKDVENRIIQLYQVIYQRNPTPRQLEQGLTFLKSSPLEESSDIKRESRVWSYGYGEFDQASTQVKGFTPLPHFTGDAWQGGKAWPDEKLGWAQLTASGGHAGNDRQHAVTRRWTAPSNGTFAIEATLKHEHAEGHGVDCYIVSSRKGPLGSWTVHNKRVETNIESVELKEGDTIDFVTSIHESLNNNDFIWSPVIRMVQAPIKTKSSRQQWNAAKEFGGPPGELQKPLTPWEQYAQVLLLSNEFLFVD
jgi:hypothetical protein